MSFNAEAQPGKSKTNELGKAEPKMEFIPIGGMAYQDQTGQWVSLHQGEFIFSLRSEEAGLLADFVSVASDFERAKQYAESCLAHQDNQHLFAPLFEASIIAYGRSFKGGQIAEAGRKVGPRSSRFKAKDLIDQLDEPLSAVHTELIRLRDKCVAHNVEDEASIVNVEYDARGGFVSVAPLIIGMSMSTGVMQGLVRIVDQLLPTLHEKVSERLQLLEEQLRGSHISSSEARKFDHSSGEWVQQEI